ncbi:hypothetical protein N0V93_005111 [Gnomoniopsis smithogilvyi]|uniref:PXA domain-containing protein n=1 Tax=Gnomoniopsis smithogilvyi TaxID=1191159 RepID=A0A9W8YSQ7_9PEZI|nr:hypothetical protein N0V93_005111 [Gnomoniopsis smithogilvyi]
MTTDAQSKAASSSSSSASLTSEPLLATDPSTPRPRSKHSHSSSNASKRRVARPNPSEFLSDRATSLLVRRVLCPQHVGDRARATPPPIDELLPPLTSRNDVDLQLYAIIAIVIRDFVQMWYTKITPDDAFVDEIVAIIAHCTRALEQRLRKVDIESLLFDELPDLFDRHVQAYRASRQPIVQPPIEVDANVIYHSMCPLPYLSPIPKPEEPVTALEQAENEVAYRQLLVQGVLAVLLPTEDLENTCLTSLVGQILSELIVGGVVVKKASEPWMIWTGLTILADVMNRRKDEARGLDSRRKRSNSRSTRGVSIPGLLWSLVHYIFAFITMTRIIISTVARSRSLPPRDQVLLAKNDASHYEDGFGPTGTSPEHSPQSASRTPILAFGIWTTISNLLETDRRMPWLLGSLSMIQWLAIAGPGAVAGFNGLVDRLLSDSIHRYILDPAMLPTALRNLRGALFPNNAMGTQTLFPPESDEELRVLRRKCARAIWSLCPRSIGRLYFSGSGISWLAARFANPDLVPSTIESQRSGPTTDNGGDGPEVDPDAAILTVIETDILDVFSDPYCNKHLMYSALELVLVRLMPELGEQGIAELWEERLN